MASRNDQRAIWEITARQFGAIARTQLLDLGLTPAAIRHRVATGRLHRVWPGVYAVGRPGLSREGTWWAAVLTCGEGAVLSHTTAAEAWGIDRERGGPLHVTAPAKRVRSGIVTHRRIGISICEVRGIPVTSPVETLVDLAAILEPAQVTRAVNEADKLNVVRADALRQALEPLGPRPGLGRLRAVLDRETFRLTDSELERRFLRIVRRAGLQLPVTGATVNGFKTDFWWPDLRLVVETDGLTYHRTPAQQARDRLRDQAHARAGLAALRFTHAQVFHDPGDTETTLRDVAKRQVAGS